MPYLEERIEELEKRVIELTNQNTEMNMKLHNSFVSCGELAKIMDCSVQNIYRKIRTGEIFATNKVGDARIPMSQFYKDMAQKQEKPVENSLKNYVFGGDL